jgi:hypothetical protein
MKTDSIIDRDRVPRPRGDQSPRGRRDAEVVGGPRISVVRLTALIPCEIL